MIAVLCVQEMTRSESLPEEAAGSHTSILHLGRITQVCLVKVVCSVGKSCRMFILLKSFFFFFFGLLMVSKTQFCLLKHPYSGGFLILTKRFWFTLVKPRNIKEEDRI